MARVSVYIDGFNLYYRRLQFSSYKWLDVWKLGQCLAPGEPIIRVRYFTARIRAKPWGDPRQPQRQQVYLRAIDTLPGVTIHTGTFKLRKKHLHLVGKPKKTAHVYVPEEKGSDVNLATYLLRDGFYDEYDLALVVSNDSDLKQPIHIARRYLKKRIGVILPGSWQTMPSGVLPCDLEGRITRTMLHKSQLPPTLTDANGTISKPPTW